MLRPNRSTVLRAGSARKSNALLLVHLRVACVHRLTQPAIRLRGIMTWKVALPKSLCRLQYHHIYISTIRRFFTNAYRCTGTDRDLHTILIRACSVRATQTQSMPLLRFLLGTIKTFRGSQMYPMAGEHTHTATTRTLWTNWAKTTKTSVYIGGYPQTPNATDTITVTVYNSALSGGQYTMPVFSVPSGDVGNTTYVARDLAIAISGDPTLSAARILCSYVGTEDILYTSGSNPITVTVSSAGSTTATVGGGGKLAEVDNDVIANSSIAYSYDALNRTVNRMIDGANNNNSWGYDAMSRITSETNALGTFEY